MRPKTVHFIPAILWMALITILLLMPSSNLPEDPFLDMIFFDKWVHLALFGGMVVLFSLPFLRTYFNSPKIFLLVTILVLVYGILLEFVQRFYTTDREFDMLDIVADAFGCVIGFFFMLWINTKNKKPL